jgi:two-component SAPR family response regulator
MNYPAIVYSRKGIDNTNANNIVYKQDDSYELTVIDPDPDSDVVRNISKLPMCRHDRHYKKDGLNHDTFTLYLS